MGALLQDLRYSVRRLGRAPGFAFTAVLTLALGIGANTAVFSLVNAVLLQPTAGVADPDRVVALFTSDFSSTQYGATSYPDFEDMRALRDVFTDAHAKMTSPVNVIRGTQVERLQSEVVTAGYLSLLGVHAAAGRLFSEQDMAGAASPVMVLSHDAWRSRFGGDPSVIGSAVQVNGQPFTIIGVAAPRFDGMSPMLRIEAWIPLPFAEPIVGATATTSRDSRGLSVFARLAPGVTIASAQARVRGLQQRLFAAYPEEWSNVRGTGRDISVFTEREARVPPDQRGGMVTLAGVLLGAVALVLVICCANTANLLLARATARSREVAIRYSLGAGRVTVLRQLIVESCVLALLGGGAGLLLAMWSTDLLLAQQGSSAQPLFLNLSLDARVLGYTLFVSVMTAVAFGLVPALQSTRADLGGIMKAERALNGARRTRLRDVLVGAQIALAFVLAVGAGLLARTLQKASEVDLGVNTERMVVARMDLRTQGYEPETMHQFYDQLRTSLEARADVEAVTYAARIPVAQPAGRRGISVVGHTPQPGEEMEFPFNVVAPNYFDMMQMPLVQGRSFTDADRADTPGAIIVNETFAQRFWPAGNAIGRQVQVGDGTFEVVGIARDGKYWSVSEGKRPYFYLAAAQQSSPLLQLHVRARANESVVMTIVRETVRQIDPLLPIVLLDTMEGQIAGSMITQRTAGALVGVFAVLAIMLAALGVYGVTSVLVAQRVPEIGLRVALGANTVDILRLIVGHAALVAAMGLGVGIALAAIGTRTLESMLFGVGRFDLTSFGIAAASVALAALLAGYLPARRAARLDPLIALNR